MGKTSTSGAKRKKNRPKTKLGIPDLEHSKAAVLRSLASPDSRRGYQHAIDEFVAWYCSEPRLAFNKRVVLRYRFYEGQDRSTKAEYMVPPNREGRLASFSTRSTPASEKSWRSLPKQTG